MKNLKVLERRKKIKAKKDKNKKRKQASLILQVELTISLVVKLESPPTISCSAQEIPAQIKIRMEINQDLKMKTTMTIVMLEMNLMRNREAAAPKETLVMIKMLQITSIMMKLYLLQFQNSKEVASPCNLVGLST